MNYSQFEKEMIRQQAAYDLIPVEFLADTAESTPAPKPKSLGRAEWLRKKQEEKDKDMYRNLDVNVNAISTPTRSDTQIAKEHLLSRARDIVDKKKETLREHFHIDPISVTGKTYGEIKALLTSGKFNFPGYKDEDRSRWGNWAGNIEFRDQPADADGYEAAKKLLRKAYNDLGDDIIVKDTADGLAALRAFEAQQFS